MRVLIIDNYDSFTYNLFHYVKKCGVEVEVKRNDSLDFDFINQYDKIVLSPGPGLPADTTNMLEVLQQFSSSKPILGVCLGMQGIANYFGGKLLNQERVRHGYQACIEILDETPLFTGVPKKINVGLYHSWKVDEASLANDFLITAKSTDDVIMAIEHKNLPIMGVQFHPESILTEYGLDIVRNFLTNY